MKKFFLILFMFVFLFKTNVYAKDYIIGDSRVVGMETLDENNDFVFLAESGSGYDKCNLYLNSINMKKTDNIILCHGINDLYNIEKYIKIANDYSDKCRIYYLTINPVEEVEEKLYNITNEDIENFNNVLFSNLNKEIIIINSYDYLIEDGYKTVDGLHYDTETSLKILNYIKENIKKEKPLNMKGYVKFKCLENCY